MKKHIQGRICTFSILALTLVLQGCGDEGPVERSWGKMKGLDKLVGNMNDVSYSQTRDQEPRPNASGGWVSMADFEGEFVWVEYAAPWCPTCQWQAPETKKVENELAGSVVFVTIMTGKSTTYNDHATVETAEAWARRYNLDAERVLAAQLWFKTIPEHRLFSPQGHTLFVHVGSLSADQIRQVIAYYKSGWEEWSKTGTPAKWMTFQ